ncbi:type II toxin-antitoxin system VapC family toxin [Polyangium aurulentum]|uniref:type II toxin-antitoxin system VapC family toxin n=1 Tax=Polyangium aurulentum TaxID=2567896 RepID=UPI0010AE1E66|nr:type II toxin-antitoxin system VapC family toxin [Polyangium aurulentum]UQA61745.1 type II toxin-antitoxin system VapC family toxin [Polyangium aurulentum]
MADVVLDANVLVGLLDLKDALHRRARGLISRLELAGHALVLLDVCMSEALSVLCRRAEQRRQQPPELDLVLAAWNAWYERGEIFFVTSFADGLFPQVLSVVADSEGRLNVNDALLVVLQRQEIIGDVASFDEDFDAVADFRRVA